MNVHHFPTEQLETAGSIYYPPGRLGDPVCVEKPDGRGEDRVLYRMTDMGAMLEYRLCVSPG